MPHHSARVHPAWVLAVPVAAAAFAGLEVAHVIPMALPLVQIAAAILMVAAVFSAVHHAEVIALRVGEPFGSLVLAVSVTVIEVALILSMMATIEDGASEIARDTVFAAFMIVTTGIVGFCLLVGGIRHHEQGFQVHGATGALGVLGTLAVLALILPNFTVAVPGPSYSTGQLLGVAALSLILYGLFLFVQSFKHREYFIGDDPDEPHPPPPRPAFLASLVLLVLALVGVVLIAEGLSPAVESAVALAGLPGSFVGVVIAAVVLMPEGLAAVRAARANLLQRSLNLALGSSLASIGLSIPVVAVASIVMGIPLTLGLDAEHIVLLVLALFACTLTLGTGRTTVLQGGVHLVIFGAFLVISAVP